MSKTLAAAVAVGATGVLVFGSTSPAGAIPPEPPPLYLYAGGTHGSGQPSHTSETEWEAFLGPDHQPPAYTVQYPRDLAPLVGDTTLDDSVDEGVREAVRLFLLHDEGAAINLVGVSQGAVVMARSKRELIDAEGVDPKRIYVLTYGDPTNPDGGFLAKLDRLNVNIPGFKPVTHTPGEGGYVTVVIEYDVIADSPDNLNPVSWANALMGASYDHATYSKPLADAALAEHRIVSNTEEWYQAPGDDQAVAYYQHNLIKQKNLPVTRPLRDIGTEIADDDGDVRVNRAVDRLDNLLRPIVDAGYDGGEPGGTRHVGTTTKHYPDASETTVTNPAVAEPKTSRTPVRDAIKTVSEAVKKLTNRLAPKPAE